MDNSVDQVKDLLRCITGQVGGTWQGSENQVISQIYTPIPPLWMSITFEQQNVLKSQVILGEKRVIHLKILFKYLIINKNI